MGKLAILIIVLMLGVLALFAVYNNDITTITVPFDKPYEISKMGLILVSSLFGAFAMLAVFVIRDTRRFMVTYQYQRKQKKEEKLQSLYSTAVNAILADDEPGAVAALNEILRVEPQHADALLRLGDLSAAKGRFEEAEAHYKKAHSAGPRSLEPLFSLEGVMEKTEKWKEALGYAENILDVDPDNLTALYRKRTLLERQGRWDDVLDTQKAIIRHVHDEKARRSEQANQLGYSYELARDSLERGELEKANKGFRAILRDDKDFVPAYLGVVEALLAEGESEAAVSFLEKGYESTSSMILLARLEDLLISLGEPSRLIRTYRKAVSARPQDEMLKFFLGKLFFRLEMIEDSLETLSALESSDTNPDVHKLLGELYLRREQCDKAVEQFKKTIELRRTFRVPYCCDVCGHEEAEWSGRCPECKNWNSYRLNPHGPCKA